jgi:glutaredoxin
MVSYTLFYSKKCSHSRQYIRYLEQFPNINTLFKKVCTDDVYINPNIKAYIKKYKIDRVPTIIVNNNKIYGYDAFKWLEHNANEMNSIYPSLNKQNYSDIMQQEKGGNIGPLDDFRGNQTLFSDSNNLMGFDNQGPVSIQPNSPIPQKTMNQPQEMPIPDALKPIECKAKSSDVRDRLQEYETNRNHEIEILKRQNDPYMYR